MKNSYRSEYLNMLEGGGVLYERDVLSFMLSNAYGGRDMREIADRLLERFPSIGAILHADVAEITAVEGVSERMALYLKTLAMLEKYDLENELKEIKDGDDFISRIPRRFLKSDNERAEFYLVNARGKVIGVKEFTSRRVQSIELRTDEFLAFLTGSKAHALYCVHNHVEGSCLPSAADDKITRKISLLSANCNIKFIDHAIVDCKGNVFSYLKSGRLALLIKE